MRIRNLVYGGMIGLLVLAATGLRVRELDRRPMHHDEANQAVRTGMLLDSGVYRYDPADHHGPSLYFFSVPIAKLVTGGSSADLTETVVRVVPVIFGIGLLCLLPLLHDGVGWRATAIAVLLATISPAVVYYNRFYIQESLLVFFTFGAIACGWRYLRSPSVVWVVPAGVCLGMMHATKETCVLAYVAMGLGVLPAWIRTRRPVPVKHVVILVAVALVVSVAFFSSFFTYWRGPVDSFLAYFSYANRAGDADTGHIHPWNFYLKQMLWTRQGGGPVWTEASIAALAVIGAVSAFVKRLTEGRSGAFVRFVAVYTVVLVVAYSVIPYKTPWCMLSFWIGVILLAGVGADALLTLARPWPVRLVVALLLVAAVVHLGRLTRLTLFRFDCDPRNPHAYVHTTRDYMRLVERIRDVTALAPEKDASLIAVIAPPTDTWPAPWYLRRYAQVGYWTAPEQVPDGVEPALVIMDPEWEDMLVERIRGEFQREYYGLRPEVLTSLHIRRDLWDAFIASRTAPQQNEP